MYLHNDFNSPDISLHDCRSNKISYKDDILSFIFPEGFWIIDSHPENKSDNLVRTDASQVDFKIIDPEFYGIEIYIFKKGKLGKTVRKEITFESFMNDINNGRFELEFVTKYAAYQSVLYKCYVWFDKKPYNYECEIVLRTEGPIYYWNKLRYDHTW